MHPVWCAGNTVLSGWLIVCWLACWLWLGLWVLLLKSGGLKILALLTELWSPLAGLSNCHFVSLTKAFRCCSLKIQIQHYTVDYLAQGSMKNGANSEMPCELQDTWTSTLWTQIAEISSSCFHTWLRVGLTSIKQLAVLHWAVTVLSLSEHCVALRFADWVYSLSTLGISNPGLSVNCCSRAGWTFQLYRCRQHDIIYDLSLGKITGRI